ncbi:hypothetical protein [Falsiroseomonas sp. HW251]|uniref:hypothetical protein n=1 Tax=Falsiroseomonas sp. HW251 TaxID=3390998 RepID=UPI003D311F3F
MPSAAPSRKAACRTALSPSIWVDPGMHVFLALLGVVLAFAVQLRADDLLSRARWLHVVSEAPKLMLAAPGENHPVLVFMDCVPGSGTVRVTVEAGLAVEAGQRVRLSLRAGRRLEPGGGIAGAVASDKARAADHVSAPASLPRGLRGALIRRRA